MKERAKAAKSVKKINSLFLTWGLIGVLLILTYFFILKPVIENGSHSSEESSEIVAEGGNSDHAKDNNQQENQYQQLAINSYGDQPDFSSASRSGNQKSDAYGKAVVAFNEQDYKQALEQLGPSSKEDENPIRYLRGHVYFQMQDYEKGLWEFRAAAENKSASNLEEAEWYLLLNLLALYPKHLGEFEILALRLAEDQSKEYSSKTRAMLVQLAKLQE